MKYRSSITQEHQRTVKKIIIDVMTAGQKFSKFSIFRHFQCEKWQKVHINMNVYHSIE